MRIALLISFLLIFCLFYRDIATSDDSTAAPLAGTIFPFKDRSAELTLTPATVDTISPLPAAPSAQKSEQKNPEEKPIDSKIKTRKIGVPLTKHHSSPPAAAPIEAVQKVVPQGPPEVATSPKDMVVKEKAQNGGEKSDPVDRPYELRQLIKKAANTYYFSDIENAQNDVTVTLTSITPYGQNDILQFEIKNTQDSFFFLSNVTIKRDDRVILGELYTEQLIRPGGKSIGLAVVPKLTKTLGTLTILESGGRARIFNLKFYVQ